VAQRVGAQTRTLAVQAVGMMKFGTLALAAIK
jgi:hypothetical protein